MVVQPFSAQQLFKLKRQTLEKRLTDYYGETQDTKTLLNLLIALQIRDALGNEDFSQFLRPLVRQLFLKTTATRVLRHYYCHFESYFSAKEWQTVLARLFPIKIYLTKLISKFRSIFQPETLIGLTDS
ncbi:hypothetical protein ACFFH2_06305 [Enterococcus devriesei]|uniref:Uncharacterized protein n=1 Tax=Enterococcus devriesei TaxID=319970 RepID=A0A1L8SXW4_9ENTE|nr:hypothetical protein [Enterococcus devriesei]MBU5364431.1 hypothetical protein [Enterococcus devriesei]OJG36714.1 hypothetical protein RV00_GL001159 [Enterococcus devriesei]